MPKLKTHSASKKRFALTGTGKIKRKKMNRNHILTKKSTKRKRHLRGGGLVHHTNEAAIKKLLPYA